jgi:hypothetical protein
MRGCVVLLEVHASFVVIFAKLWKEELLEHVQVVKRLLKHSVWKTYINQRCAAPVFSHRLMQQCFKQDTTLRLLWLAAAVRPPTSLVSHLFPLHFRSVWVRKDEFRTAGHFSCRRALMCVIWCFTFQEHEYFSVYRMAWYETYWQPVEVHSLLWQLSVNAQLFDFRRSSGYICQVSGSVLSSRTTTTPWSRGLLEKLTVSQLVKNFPAFYGTRRFITAFTRARHMPLSWASRSWGRTKESVPVRGFFICFVT